MKEVMGPEEGGGRIIIRSIEQIIAALTQLLLSLGKVASGTREAELTQRELFNSLNLVFIYVLTVGVRLPQPG